MVSIFTVTNRPHFINNVIENYRNQTIKEKELIVIINTDDWDKKKQQAIVQQAENILVYHLPSKVTLGECCNYAVKKTKYPLVAKFDDDDYYGPNYLMEDIKLFQNRNVHLVGKHEHFIYFQTLKLLAKSKAHRKSPILGATFIFRKKLNKRIPFRPLNLGEDTAFIHDVLDKGYNLHYSTPYNYVYIRYDRSHHTWKAPQKKLLQTSKKVCYTDDFRSYIKSEMGK